MKRLGKRISAYMLALVMVFEMLPTTVFAEEQNNSEIIIQEEMVTENKQTITGFESLSEEQSKFIINDGDKPDLETLLSAFPQSLNVYVENEVEAVDVDWYCVGEDFEASDSYYFQFSPSWDETKYMLAEEINLLKDAPYISVFITTDNGISEMAVTSSANETVIYNFLKNEMGLNTAAACGVLANLYKESSFNPNATGDKGTSYGICQWHNARWDAMKTWCTSNGYDWTTLTGQLYYLKFELSQNNYKYLWNGKTIYNYISAVEDTAEGAYDAAYYWCYYFEVPADKENVSVTRGNLAKNTYWEEYKDDSTAPIGPFVDVYENMFYYEPVLWAVEKGITTGKTETLFAPDETCTRGQVVTFLWRAVGSPEPETTENPFTDVTSDWYYYDAVLWAYENGITTGKTADQFAPNDTCNRGQVVTFLWRAMGSPEPTTTVNPFEDVTSDWFYYYAVLWAAENGITTGKTTAEFAPNDICNRGQMVTFLYRTLNE